MSPGAVPRHPGQLETSAPVSAPRGELTDARNPRPDSFRVQAADLDEAQGLGKLGFWSEDFPQGEVRWSNEVFRIFDMDPDLPEHSARPILEFIHPQDRATYLQHREKSRLTGMADECTVRAVGRTRGLFWIRVLLNSRANALGAFTHQFGVVMDVTETRRAALRMALQHDLTQALALHTTLGEALPKVLEILCKAEDWVFAASWREAPDGKHLRCIDTWSAHQAPLREFEAAQRAWSIPLDKAYSGFMQWSWTNARPGWLLDASTDATYNRRASAAAAHLRGAFVIPIIANGEVLRLMEFYSRDARQPDAHLLELAVSIGHQIGQFILRRNAEAKLNEAVFRLELAVQASGIGFWSGNLVSGETHFTEQFTRMLGYEIEELPRRFDQFEELVHPDEKDHFKEVLRKGIPSGQQFSMEMRLRIRDGSYRWFVGRAKATHVVQGIFTQFAGSLADIQERKQLELAKDEFVATVSHELRTPLTSIRGAISLLDGGIAGQLSEDAKQLTGVAMAGCDRLSRLVNDALNLAALKQRTKPVLLPLALDDALRSAFAQNRVYCDELGVNINCSPGAPDAQVLGDSDMLGQILGNFISNAAKFSARGGTVEVTSQRNGNDIRIKVIDHGHGVPQAFRSRIFGRFQQADNSNGRLHQGSGLGLSIARELASKMAGAIDFCDTPGGGATFFLDMAEYSRRT